MCGRRRALPAGWSPPSAIGLTGAVTGADSGCSKLGLLSLELAAIRRDYCAGGIIVLTRARLHQGDFGLKALDILGLRLAAAGYTSDAAHLA